MASAEVLLRDFYKTIWIEGDCRRAGDFFAPGSVAAGLYPDLQVRGQELAEFSAALLAHAEVLDITLGPCLQDGDWTAALVRVKAQRRDTGQTLETSAMVMVRIQDGLIAEAYNAFDFLSFFEALDLVPPNAAALCLAGHRLS